MTNLVSLTYKDCRVFIQFKKQKAIAKIIQGEKSRVLLISLDSLTDIIRVISTINTTQTICLLQGLTILKCKLSPNSRKYPRIFSNRAFDLYCEKTINIIKER